MTGSAADNILVFERTDSNLYKLNENSLEMKVNMESAEIDDFVDYTCSKVIDRR